MQSVVKEILKLTAKSESSQWLNAESKLMDSLSTFEPSGIAQVAFHFAKNGQGTDSVWQEIDKATVSQLENFNAEELVQITQAFVDTEYEVSDELDIKLMEGIDQWFESELSQAKKTNPYIVLDLQKEYQLIIQSPFSGGAVQTHTEGGIKNHEIKKQIKNIILLFKELYLEGSLLRKKQEHLNNQNKLKNLANISKRLKVVRAQTFQTCQVQSDIQTKKQNKYNSMDHIPELQTFRIKEVNFKLDCMKVSKTMQSKYNSYADRHISYVLNKKNKQSLQEIQLPTKQQNPDQQIKVQLKVEELFLPPLKQSALKILSSKRIQANAEILNIYGRTQIVKQSRSLSTQTSNQKIIRQVDREGFLAFLSSIKAQILTNK